MLGKLEKMNQETQEDNETHFDELILEAIEEKEVIAAADASVKRKYMGECWKIVDMHNCDVQQD